MEWNNDWRSELEIKNPECYERLCECRNTKHDILIIAKLMYRYNQDRTKEDCLDRTIGIIKLRYIQTKKIIRKFY